MPNVFIIHGRDATPEDNWFPWLKDELEEIGCTVFVPRFPTPQNQTLENWLKVFKQFEKYVNQDTIFVGHSVGATFILDLVEKLDKKVSGMFLVAGFVTKPPYEDCKTFCEKKFDWDRIKKNCKYVYVINSDNDSRVGLDLSEKISKPLGVTLTVIEGAGHFLKVDGYTRFPQLLDMIEDTLTDL